MKRNCAVFTFVILALIAPALILGQTKVQKSAPKTANQIVGTWKAVAITLDQNGKKTDLYGPNPKGITIFTPDGYFARVITRSALPKFASNNRETGTPEENKAVVGGSVALFGTYTCNAADKTCMWNVESSTFPNWIGAVQKRIFVVNGDEMRETNPTASTGSGQSLNVWKRVRK